MSLMMKKWLLLATAVALAGTLGGCASGSSEVQTVQIDIQNMVFSTREIVLKKGVPAKLVLANKDTQVHDLSVDDLPLTDLKAGQNGHHQHAVGATSPDLHVSAEPGQSGAVAFTPTTSGTYVFYCTVPGHKASGMQGTLVVR